ncbi:Flp family type IVb pilin [Phyllobacterium leguminum]|uniref:Pilus assembly protein Flp/PilA n=1 Tax=Phyllobacterium leguminum TaxID=314237 RepID=A0A318T3H6_9HYPH|nr:Flp family type IVb pilin [Phyllobacterium leguminum]PYE89242.1 pilus assembly protein Flp/PilA [Phyllobacterium leguminum]
MKNLIARFAKDESGATAIEYGLIAALISVGIITGASMAGKSIAKAFTDVGNSVNGAVPVK